MDAEGWFFESDHERMGPISLAELQWLVSVGILRRDTRVWADGMDEPARAEALPLLFQRPLPAPPRVRRSGWALVGYLCLALIGSTLAMSLVYSVRQLVGH